MKINENVMIKGQKIILVPYEVHHVEKYHSWMQSKELQELTASEPLTLDDEYKMQKSWRDDDDKCTFIILDAIEYENTSREIDSMVGDTNIFLNMDELYKAEIEIMIAEKDARQKGFGSEAVKVMMLYGILYLGIKEYYVKILQNNEVSINMFKNLGFKQIHVSDVFKEVSMKRIVDSDFKLILESSCKINISTYS